MFIFILAVFLIPYGVITTALLYPNEMVCTYKLKLQKEHFHVKFRKTQRFSVNLKFDSPKPIFVKAIWDERQCNIIMCP